jgi:hypothetical protein
VRPTATACQSGVSVDVVRRVLESESSDLRAEGTQGVRVSTGDGGEGRGERGEGGEGERGERGERAHPRGSRLEWLHFAAATTATHDPDYHVQKLRDATIAPLDRAPNQPPHLVLLYWPPPSRRASPHAWAGLRFWVCRPAGAPTRVSAGGNCER